LNYYHEGGFGIYLHWPFCQSKCPYCDFNSHVASKIDQARWKAAYLSEIDRLGVETGDRILNSVFFGGGTPSLMDPDLVEAIIDRIGVNWRFSNDPEITLEANPTSVEFGRFSAFAAAGVNRVSIGVQSLDDRGLRMLGRKHSATEAIKAIEVAKSCFPRVSFDLMYARQDQDSGSWRNELAQALDLEPTHLSLYQLTIEEGTVFFDRHARGLLRGLPDEDLSSDLYQMTQQMCESAGLPAYEVSNHAAPGQESRHNMTYWRGGDYIGIGPGAHGRLTLNGTRTATECPKSPYDWLEQVEQSGYGELPRLALSAEETTAEYLIMGLRLRDGIDLGRLYRTPSVERIKQLSEHGLVELTLNNLRVTSSGMLLLNEILRKLLAE
jgi:putative oxygen-independent coproporphyrinogen III oxidase